MTTLRTGLLVPILLALSATAAAQSLNGPESVEFHPRSGRTLVSNKSAGEILWRASDGSLSTFSTEPVTPYGIEYLRGVVYVVDSGHLKGYDVDSAAAVFDLAISGALTLNGITSDGDHTLYLTDFNTGQKKLIKVDIADPGNPVQTPLATLSQQPNGVVFDRANNRLLIVTWGANAKILSYDVALGGTPTTLINTAFSNIDGIALDCHGAIYVTPWTCGTGGCLRRYDPPFTLTSVAQSVGPALNNPADIDYSQRTGQIAIPESGGNRITVVDSGCEASLYSDDFER